MLKNYIKELSVIGLVFGLISYTVYVFAAEPTKTQPVAVTTKKETKQVKPARPAKEVKPVAEPEKKEHKKKPTLKKKYADKK
jgi:hypothetical protein